MKVKCYFANVQTPLFLGGTNLGTKLVVENRVGLELEMDEENRILHVTYNGKSCRVLDCTSYHANEFDSPKAKEITNDAKKKEFIAKAQGKVKAQVSTPTSHVFDGPGAGQK